MRYSFACPAHELQLRLDNEFEQGNIDFKQLRKLKPQRLETLILKLLKASLEKLLIFIFFSQFQDFEHIVWSNVVCNFLFDLTFEGFNFEKMNNLIVNSYHWFGDLDSRPVKTRHYFLESFNFLGRGLRIQFRFYVNDSDFGPTSPCKIIWFQSKIRLWEIKVLRSESNLDVSSGVMWKTSP